MKSADDHRHVRPAGMTLIEVMVSIALVTVVILGALMVRYHAVRQAIRGDAYETAARVGQLLLEGWRSTELLIYEPNDRFPDQLMFHQADDGPDVTADGFTAYVSPNGVTNYEVIFNNRHYYATLGYLAVPTPLGYKSVTTVGAEVPPVIHVAVAFLNNYTVWSDAANINTIKLTSYK